LGQEVLRKQIAHNAAGKYNFAWDGTVSSGQSVSTGVYFCQVTFQNIQQQIKFLFLK